MGARGGIILDIFWSDGTLQGGSFGSPKERTYYMRYQGQTVEVALQAGEEKTVTPEMFH